MQWRRAPGDDPGDPNGVADLLARAIATVDADRVEGTRFEFRTIDMIAASRKIEGEAVLDPSAPLLVGVQLGRRLLAQSHVYEPMIRAGVTVHAFGTDADPGMPGCTWTTVPDDPLSLAANWYVVHNALAPAALVGFELDRSPGGRRVWEGFVSRDPGLVALLAEHLNDMRTVSAPG